MDALPSSPVSRRQQLERDGFVLLPSVFDAATVEHIIQDLERAFARRTPRHSEGASIRGQEGSIYAARNVLTLWPAAADVWRRPSLTEALADILGPAYGLVRVLFFDKPPPPAGSAVSLLVPSA
jgi:hypothetical protein